jgi:glucoamylase
MGFIVAGDGRWYEVKAVATYQVQTADPAVPLASIVHTGPAQHPYQLTVQVIPDPGRDVVLVSYTLDGVSGARLYVFLASHLQQHPAANADQDYSGGSDNTAWVDSGGSLFAQGAGRFLCLSSAAGFAQASVGCFGSSDLWQDFDRNGSMTWNFTDAGPGFVVRGGELSATSGAIALAFATDAATAGALAAASLAAGSTAAGAELTNNWQAWSGTCRLPPSSGDDPAGLADALSQSATVLRVHQDCASYPGAIVAGLCTPWGDASNNPGGIIWSGRVTPSRSGLHSPCSGIWTTRRNCSTISPPGNRCMGTGGRTSSPTARAQRHQASPASAGNHSRFSPMQGAAAAAPTTPMFRRGRGSAGLGP